MKIAFNGLSCGLANNGGSRTILRCCETLNEIGHECVVLSKIDKFTWFKHIKPLLVAPDNLDVVINLAAVDFNSTLTIRSKVKAWYIRAHETWSTSIDNLIRLYLYPDVVNIVNSKGLQVLLKSFGAKSQVVYQGIDFDWWEDKKLRTPSITRIGCLYSQQPLKKWKDFVKLHDILGDKNYEYISVGSAKPSDRFITKSYVNVDHNELCNAYSSCNVWFAPTESEGLHNVPLEANLCGCLVVCSDAPLNGMVYDYAFNGETAMVYENNNIEQAAQLIKNADYIMVPNMQSQIKNKVGNREDNMKKLVQILESL